MRNIKDMWVISTNRGIRIEDSTSRRIALRATNTMLLTSIPAFLLYDLIALAAQDYVLFAAISISLLIHVGAYILAGYPHLNLKSRRTAALNVNFIVFFLALATGKQSGVEFLFVSLACVVFLPFERKEKSSTFFFVFFIVSSVHHQPACY